MVNLKYVRSVTRCHHVALRGSFGPQLVIFAPYASLVLYSYEYVGPTLNCESRAGKLLTSLFQLSQRVSVSVG